MKKILFLITFFLPIYLSGQAYQINGTINNYHSAKIYLASVYGDKFDIQDSIKSDFSGKFTFSIPDDTPTGLFRLYFANNKTIDLILNKENITFTTELSEPVNQIKISASTENQIYYRYILKRNYDQYRLELLQPVLFYYPITDPFYQDISSQFNQIQQGLNTFTQKLLDLNSQTYAGKLIAIDRKPLINIELNPQQQQVYLREHYFDLIKFDDPSLLRSNAITSSLLTYLSLYQDQSLTKDQLEDEFIRAVDMMLAVTAENIEIHNFAIEYLINGFESYGFDKVNSHIANILMSDEDCENLEDETELARRLATIKMLSPGKQAPAIIAQDLNHRLVELKSITSKYTMLVFWASWCPHCTTLLPDLHEFYLEVKDQMEVISISIDTSQKVLNDFIVTHNFEWPTICQFEGWDSPLAKIYGIYSTPTLLLLDENKIIIGRPGTIGEIRQLIK